MSKCQFGECDKPAAGRVIFDCGRGCCEQCGLPMCKEHVEKIWEEEKHANRIDWFEKER